MPTILVLDNVRSGINTGSVFRSADAFSVERIFLCGITPVPPNKEILKSALGATESVKWEYAESASNLIRSFSGKTEFNIISVEQAPGSIPLQDYHPDPDKTSILVFGNEVDGVNQDIIDLSDCCVEIPQFGAKHSLNIAVSAGIVLWDIFSKLNLKDPEIKV